MIELRKKKTIDHKNNNKHDTVSAPSSDNQHLDNSAKRPLDRGGKRRRLGSGITEGNRERSKKVGRLILDLCFLHELTN